MRPSSTNNLRHRSKWGRPERIAGGDGAQRLRRRSSMNGCTLIDQIRIPSDHGRFNLSRDHSQMLASGRWSARRRGRSRRRSRARWPSVIGGARAAKSGSRPQLPGRAGIRAIGNAPLAPRLAGRALARIVEARGVIRWPLAARRRVAVRTATVPVMQRTTCGDHDRDGTSRHDCGRCGARDRLLQPDRTWSHAPDSPTRGSPTASGCRQLGAVLWI